MSQKTLLVGLDAACWEILNPLLQAGRLPTLQKWMTTGAWGVLDSTMPAMTPAAWSSIITGKNPGKHGVFEMFWRKPESYKFSPTSGRFRHGSPFWKYLNDAGLRVGLVNVPFTHPPAPVDGFMLCAFGTPEEARDLTWPPEALEWVEAEFGPYKPAVPTDLLRSGNPEKILAAEKEHQSRLVEIGLALAERYPVDVLVINLMLTDHANHKLPDMDMLEDAYVHADADLQKLLNGYAPDNVMLISDHGSSRLKGDFLLNVWLRDQGYCVYVENTPAQKNGARDWVLNKWLNEDLGWSGVLERVLRRLLRRFLPRAPRGVRRRFWERVEQAIPFAETHVNTSTTPDFNRTRVFPGSLYSGVLYFNVTGREPKGVVPPQEMAALSAALKDQLSRIETPDGERLFANVYASGELFKGAAAGHAPDIVVDAYGSAWNIRTRQPAPHFGKQHERYFVTFEPMQDYGWHSREGIFVFSGPAFQSDPAPGDGRLLDVPATLLHVLNVPLPEDWDGRILSENLTPELRERPAQFQPGDPEQEIPYDEGLSEQDSESLTSHLRALGYL